MGFISYIQAGIHLDNVFTVLHSLRRDETESKLSQPFG